MCKSLLGSMRLLFNTIFGQYCENRNDFYLLVTVSTHRNFKQIQIFADMLTKSLLILSPRLGEGIWLNKLNSIQLHSFGCNTLGCGFFFFFFSFLMQNCVSTLRFYCFFNILKSTGVAIISDLTWKKLISEAKKLESLFKNLLSDLFHVQIVCS